MDAIETAKEKMAKTIAVLHRDLSSLRAGRANAQVLDRIMVDYYGTPTPVNQVGNISSPEARMDAIEQIKKAQKDSEITEDDRKKLEDQAQKLTDSHIKDIDKIVSDKQKEIMEV